MVDLAAPQVHPGDVLGERYRIVERIGEGAMGTVYRVEHTEMGTNMALKLLKPELLMVPGIEERFNREARSASSLDDPHIVRVTDFGRTPEGGLFMVMELLEGQALGAAATEVSQRELLELILQVLSALEHAHDQGIVHRDLKPDNIMLVERRGRQMVKILDFGLAKITEAPADGKALTQAGTVFGTPRYMSPEQASGEPVDGRSDQYAVGVILYELLTGRILFDGQTITEILTKHITQPPPPLGIDVEEGIDGAALEAIVHRALAKVPEERFETAGQMAEALRFAAGLAAPGRGVSQPGATAFAATMVRPNEQMLREISQVAHPPAQSRRVLLGAFGVALLAGGIGAGVFAFSGEDRYEQIEFAMASGELDRAQQMATVLVSERPDDLKARLLRGHIAYAAGDAAAAVKDYEKALALDSYAAVDDRFKAIALEMVDKKSTALGALTIALSEKGDVGAAPLLRHIAEEAHTYNLRRKAYEGLERLGEDDELDRFEYLKSNLDKNRTDKCETRKWYVERLIKLDDDRVRPILEKERGRKGGFLGLERVDGCMRDMLRTALGETD